MDLIGEIVIAESVVLQNPDLKVPGLSLNNFNKVHLGITGRHYVHADDAAYQYIPENEQDCI